MIKKATILFSLILIMSFSLFAQEKNYVAGELIIQLNKKVSPEELQSSFGDIDMNVVKLLSGRMNIWLFSDNPAKISPENALFQIKQNKNVKIVQFNHYVQSRNGNSILATFPSDPLFDQQWALNNTGQSGGTPDADIDAPEAR